MKFNKVTNIPKGKNWLILITPKYSPSGFTIGYYENGCFKTDIDDENITDFVEAWAELPCFIKK